MEMSFTYRTFLRVLCCEPFLPSFAVFLHCLFFFGGGVGVGEALLNLRPCCAAERPEGTLLALLSLASLSYTLSTLHPLYDSTASALTRVLVKKSPCFWMISFLRIEHFTGLKQREDTTRLCTVEKIQWERK